MVILPILITRMNLPNNKNVEKSNQEEQTQEQSRIEEEKIMTAVQNKLTNPPTDEIPFVQTISNIDQLSKHNPQFYKDAKNGNKIIVYPHNKLAVIYDNETKTIINQGSEYFGLKANIETPEIEDITEIPEEPAIIDKEITVEIRNGSGIPGIAGELKTKLEEENITVEKLGNASNFNFKKTILIHSEEADEKTVMKLKEKIGEDIESITDLPTEETESNYDFLIILGKN